MSCYQGRRRRRESSRHHAAAGPLSAAAGRHDIPGLEVAGTVESVGAGGDAAGASATGSARSWPAAATRSTAPRRRRSACRFPRGTRFLAGRRDPGDHVHGVDERVRARTAAGRGIDSDPWRIERNRHDRDSTRACARRARVRHGRQRRRSARRAKRLGAERAINYREADFVAVDRSRSQAAAASTSCSTWSAATTCSATSTCWRWTAGWCRSRQLAA